MNTEFRNSLPRLNRDKRGGIESTLSNLCAVLDAMIDPIAKTDEDFMELRMVLEGIGVKRPTKSRIRDCLVWVKAQRAKRMLDLLD